MAEEKKKNGKKVWIIIGIILVILIILAIGGGLVIKKMTSMANGMGNDSPMLMTVEKRDLSESISLSGKISGQGQANVTSSALAEVVTVDVSVGDQVKKGDILCTMDTADIKEQIAVLEKSIDNAGQLNAMQDEQNKEALSDAKKTAAKQNEQAKKQINKAESAYSTAKKQLETDKSSLTSAKKKLESAKTETSTAKKAADSAKSAYETANANYEIENAKLSMMDKDDAGYDAQSEKVATAYGNMLKAESTYEKANEKYMSAQTNQSTYQAKVTELDAIIKEENQTLPSLKDAIDDAKSLYEDTVDAGNKSVNAANDAIKTASLTEPDKSAEKQLEELRKQLEDCTVVAPMSGVVTAVNIKPGDTNAAGTPIITIDNTDALVVTASVDEMDILDLKEGMDAVVTCNAIPDREIKGKITRVVRVIGTDANLMEQSQGYSVEVTIEDPDLLIGMSAKVKVILTDKSEVLCVPYDMVYENEKGEHYVLKATAENDGNYVANKCIVTLGEEIDYFVEILDGELAKGDTIVYEDQVEEGVPFSPQVYDASLLDGGMDMNIDDNKSEAEMN